MKLILVFVLCLTQVVLAAQKEDYIWLYNWSNSFFAEPNDEWGCSVIDFNSLPPSIYEKPEITLSSSEAHAVYCDELGRLQLFSNGQEIHGSNYIPLVNGDTINYGPRWEIFHFSGAPENNETNGFRGVQEIGFIPQPETDTILALYHNNNEYFEFGDDFNFHLMIAKISKRNGESIVLSKDQIINDKIGVKGSITACKHGNGRDWWLLQFSKSRVYTYLITNEGIALNHIQELPFELALQFTGQSKFSPSGDYFAYHGLIDINSDEGMGLMISEFDRCSGDLINPKLEHLPSFENLFDNGLEFSPNGNLLYISTALRIIQYDLTAADIYASEMVVAENNGLFNCGIEVSPNPKGFGQMQLAPDNQIYISLAVQCNDVHIIRHPNVRGVDCEVEQNAIILPTFVAGTIPTTNTYRLGPLDGSACDTLALNNHPVSRYWYEQSPTDHLTSQFWDVSYFRPEIWAWDFGDGHTSSERHPEHRYAANGIYEVCLTVSNENSSHSSCDTLFLGVSAIDDFEEKISLSFFPNPTEGPTRFLLSGYLPEDGRLTFYNLNGQRVWQEPIMTGSTVVDLSSLDIGTYVYELRDGGRLIGTGRVVVN